MPGLCCISARERQAAMTRVDDVKTRLGGQWVIRRGDRDVSASWLVSKTNPDAIVHAADTYGMLTLCGQPATGMWRKHDFVEQHRRCAECDAYLQKHGRIE